MCYLSGYPFSELLIKTALLIGFMGCVLLVLCPVFRLDFVIERSPGL